jgi:hypothetical protein
MWKNQIKMALKSSSQVRKKNYSQGEHLEF